ncbi:hypothetical protein ACFVJM_24295 [Streptomyces virginiae]|uniref:hypothetical protein n=1 Tax=Streptomyces virginiae TaxID=1961 RepID=UPI003638A484
MEDLVPVSVLALRPTPPHPRAIFPCGSVRPLIDGRDVLEEIHPEGDSSCSQGQWFGPSETWPLWADEHPRRRELSNNDCVTDCCGGVFVTIQRRGDRVVWRDWENTDDNRVPVPSEVHFDAAQYDAELARVVSDHGWEEPVDAAARLLARQIADSGWYERWNCLPTPNGINVTERGENSQVRMTFRTAEADLSTGSRWYRMPVSASEPAREQVRRFVEDIMAIDPREAAQSH